MSRQVIYLFFMLIFSNSRATESWVTEKQNTNTGIIETLPIELIERDCFGSPWPDRHYAVPLTRPESSVLGRKEGSVKSDSGHFRKDLKKTTAQDSSSIHMAMEASDALKPSKKTEAPTNQGIYLSNDDSMSLSSAQRVIYAILNAYPLVPDQIRPHEFLNFYRFLAPKPEKKATFGARAELRQGKGSLYHLAIAIDGRDIEKDSRRNLVLTVVVDRSGSMSGESRMSYLKSGLNLMTEQLKTDDVLNLVLFDHEVCTALANFHVGRHDLTKLTKVIEKIEPRGSTDLNGGINEGYLLAEKYLDKNRINRVLLITDAVTNTGVLDPTVIASIGKYREEKGIGLSGIGVGLDFNDALFDRITEESKGAYLFLGGSFAAEKVFKDNFNALIETIARNVHFRLKLPPSLAMTTFYGEEASEKKEEVKPLHFFAGSHQLYLSDLTLTGKLDPQSTVSLDIDYEAEPDGKKTNETLHFPVADLIKTKNTNIGKARMLIRFTDLLQSSAEQYNGQLASRQDKVKQTNKFAHVAEDSFAGKCKSAEKEMGELVEGTADLEIDYVFGLLKKYCG